MTVKEIVSLLHADILHTGAYLDTEINAAFGSDMMSDTLAYADSPLFCSRVCARSRCAHRGNAGHSRDRVRARQNTQRGYAGAGSRNRHLHPADKDDHVQCLRHPVSGRAGEEESTMAEKTLSY